MQRLKKAKHLVLIPRRLPKKLTMTMRKKLTITVRMKPTMTATKNLAIMRVPKKPTMTVCYIIYYIYYV